MSILNLEEVLEYGPICAVDSELGILVTVNGAYLNYWNYAGKASHSMGGVWTNTDCAALGKGMEGLYAITGAEMWDIGKKHLEKIVNGDEEEEEEEE